MLPETLSGHLCLSASRRGGLRAAPVTRLPRSSHSTLWELMWTPWSHCVRFFNELVPLIYSAGPCQILTERFTSNQKGSYLAFISSWMGVVGFIFTFFKRGNITHNVLIGSMQEKYFCALAKGVTSFFGVHLLVCLCKNLLNMFPRNLVGGWVTGQRRAH